MIKKIMVGMGSCGIAAGAEAVLELLQKKAGTLEIIEVGCIGHCYAEPLVELVTSETSIIYSNVKPVDKDIDNILNLGELGRLETPVDRPKKEFIQITALAGKINPLSMKEYKSKGGFKALEKALTIKPESVINEIELSGLRGRGGGGFPTAIKWKFLAAKKNVEEKILVCNADEGDPGAFMDRAMMESVPYQILEGMLIAAYATGATRLFIYCRAEYPLAIKNLQHAIEEIERVKLNIFSDKKITIKIKEGAGAFVCGEETALIASLEGKRGMPRFRPPFPTDSGWNGLPTLINNVETFANIPFIITETGKQYAKIGTEKSKGTKLFALAGDLECPGLVEVPMGTTIAEIVFDIGGAKKEEVKAVQIGGPSGGCIPVELFDTPVDYDSLNSLGAIMGSGGLIVIGKNRCMVETARYFLDFTHRESCGKCTFCRVGTKRMFETLGRITKGEGCLDDITFLKEIGPKIKQASLCGLGQTAANPVLATLRYFMNEYKDHIEDKVCRAFECSELVDVNIFKKKCIECGICIKNCPVDAISDDFVVDNTVCTTCNSCIEACPKNTINRIPKGEGYYSE